LNRFKNRIHFLCIFRHPARPLVYAMILLLLFAPSAHSADVSRNNTIKAGYTYRFILGNWPEEAFAATPDTITIGIAGDNSFFSFFDAVAGKPAAGWKLVINPLPLPSKEELLHCQIVFISNDLANEMEHILNRVTEAPILTVSDMDGFIEQGGMIE